MPLVKQEREILLNAGLNIKQSAELQDPATARRVENLRWDSIGELVKRPTYASSCTPAVPGDSDYTNAAVEAVFTRGNEVLGLTADHGIVRIDPTDPDSALYTHREYAVSLAADDIPKFSPKACKVTRRYAERAELGASHTGIYSATSAVYGDVLVVAWVEKGFPSLTYLKFKALDVDTGTVLSTTQTASITGDFQHIEAMPYTVAGSEGVLIVATSGSAAPYTVTSWLYNHATRDFSQSTDLTTNSKYPKFALAPEYSGEKFYFGITDNTTGFIKVQYRSIAAVTSTHDSAHHDGQQGLMVIAGSSRVLIVAVKTTVAYAEVFGTPASYQTLLSATGTETLYGGQLGLQADGTSAVAYVNTYDFSSDPNYTSVRTLRVVFTSTTPSIGSTEAVVPHSWTCGSAFTYGGRVYCPFMLDWEGVTSVIVARYASFTSNATTIASHDPVARLMHDRLFTTVIGSGGSSVSATVVSNKVHMTFTGDRSPLQIGAYGGYLPQSVFHNVLEFANNSMRLPFAQYGATTVVASGLLFEWDGDTPSEHAPVKAPVIDYIDAASGTGTSVTNLAMVAIYSWVDAQGNLHRSAPSPVANSGVVTNKQIDVYIRKLPFAAYDYSRAMAAEPELYISEDNGSTYYLATDSGGGKLLSSAAASSTTHWVFEDVQPGDPTVAAPPYSTGAGGQPLVAVPPPAPRDACTIGDRLLIIDAEDTSRIWYTKPFSAGFAPEWAAENVIIVGDDCVAIKDVSGTPVIFGANAIWTVDGSGPDALGVGSFSLPRKLHQVGCIDTTMCCATPAGIVFRGRKGFFLLNGLALEPFGVPVDPETRVTNLADYVPGRVAYDEVHSELRILDLNSAHHYVYHLAEQKWSEWTLDEDAQKHADLVTADGAVWYLQDGDGSSSIRREYSVGEAGYSTSTEPTVYQTPWLSLNGISGFGRIFELVLSTKIRTNVSNVSTLSVLYETRSPEGNGSETFSWTGAQMATLGSADEPIELRMKPGYAKCKAFRLTITELNPTAYAGSSPIAVRMIYGVDGSAKRTKTNSLKGPT